MKPPRLTFTRSVSCPRSWTLSQGTLSTVVARSSWKTTSVILPEVFSWIALESMPIPYNPHMPSSWRMASRPSWVSMNGCSSGLSLLRASHCCSSWISYRWLRIGRIWRRLWIRLIRRTCRSSKSLRSSSRKRRKRFKWSRQSLKSLKIVKILMERTSARTILEMRERKL